MPAERVACVVAAVGSCGPARDAVRAFVEVVIHLGEAIRVRVYFVLQAVEIGVELIDVLACVVAAGVSACLARRVLNRRVVLDGVCRFGVKLLFGSVLTAYFSEQFFPEGEGFGVFCDVTRRCADAVHDADKENNSDNDKNGAEQFSFRHGG